MTIHLYYLPSPNGRKISIALEEMGLPYEVQVINVFELEAQTPGYVKNLPKRTCTCVGRYRVRH